MELRILGEPPAALLARGAIGPFVKQLVYRNAGSIEESLPTEEAFRCADRRRLQARDVKMEAEAKEFGTVLLIARTAQEIFLRCDFLQEYKKSWNFEKRKASFAEGMPVLGMSGRKRGLNWRVWRCQSYWVRTRKLAWAPAGEQRTTKGELKAWRERDRRPFRRATEDEEGGKATQADDKPRMEEDRAKERAQRGRDTGEIIMRLANAREWEQKPGTRQKT